jgi:hypothetical protein
MARKPKGAHVVVEYEDGRVERTPYDSRTAAEEHLEYHRTEAAKGGTVRDIYITGR